MRLLVYMCVLVVALHSCKEEQNRPVESRNFEVVQLGQGIYSCIHKIGGKAICNVGIVDNGIETVIFDSFLSPDVAGELQEMLEAMELSPVKYVVNSHFHNDHIRGNQVFPDHVKVISTPRTQELIATEEPLQIAYEKDNATARFKFYDSLYHSYEGDPESREYQQILMWRPYYDVLTKSHQQVRTRVPILLVDSILNLDGPDREIRLISKGAGHTESDLVLYLPEEGILFSGDLTFNKCHPYVGDGNLLGWKAWLVYLKSLGIKTVMPGHGPLGTHDLLNDMLAYLIDLELRAENLLKNDLSVDENANLVVPELYREWWFDRFYEYNLKFAYHTAKERGLE